ncbi:MAG: LD-carboxypeptidase [Candidatus Diapherotrites archaeon]|nr:LD-carboxypeptidase [Candidatus Diapherotrites archaeon]
MSFETIIPKKLKKVSKIGIVTPSAPVAGKELVRRFKKGVLFLENLGFEVVVAEHALGVDNWRAATPVECAEDINSMFADKTVDAIICSIGGETANTCLPFLDWATIRENPKIFLGISDITVLLNAIHKKTGLVTFHGNDILFGFGNDMGDYELNEFLDRFQKGKIGILKKNSEHKTIRSGKAQGKLFGGNLNCLLKLAGTPYFPDLSGSVLFLEEYESTPEEADCKLNQLKQMGVFEQVNAVIVGYIWGMQKEGAIPTTQVEDVLLEVSKEFDFPILKSNDFGHNCLNTVLPVGCRVEVDADKKEISILEKCVE